MTKKNIIILAAGLAVIALLAALYGIVSFGGKDTQPDTTPDSEEIKVEKVFTTNSIEKLSSILLTKGNETEYLIRKDATIDSFLIDGLENHNYSTYFDNVISSATGLSVTGEIENPLDDSNYGLSDADEPYILTVTGVDGTAETAVIGAKLLSDDGYYCKKIGREGIFTIGNAANSFLKDKYSLISTLLEKELDQAKYHYTEKLVVYKENKKLVEISLVPENEQDKYDAYGYYRMDYPSQSYTVSDVNYDKLLKLLISPAADTVITADLSDDNLKKYGFMADDGTPNPSCEVNYTLDGEKRILYFGKRTEDGLVYVMSPASGFIGIAGVESHFPFINWELIDYVNPVLFGMNINYLSKLKIAGKDFSDTYTLEGENDGITVKNESGKLIDAKNFRSLYRVLLMTNMEGYADSTETDDLMLSFTLEKKDGRVQEFKFYRISNLKCFYTINGDGEFYVSLDDVEKIISDAKKLALGEMIDADARI